MGKDSRYNIGLIDYIDKEFGTKPFQLRDIKDPKIRKLVLKYLCFTSNLPNANFELFEIMNLRNEKGSPVKTFRLKIGVK